MGSIGEPNGHIELPDKNSPEIQLVNPTEQELLAQQEANSTEWRGALSLEAYLRREVHLANQLQTKDGGLSFWALVYQAPGDSRRQVLCGCETYRKKAMVSTASGDVEEVIAHGVGSVFCPPAFRGKGYAGRMMADLGKRLQRWQADGTNRVLFSILYSDIGKQYYARNGWQAFPSSHVSLPATKSRTPESSIQWLKSGDLDALCKIDEKLIRRRMSKSGEASRSEVALVPDVAAIQIHHAREEFIANELLGRYPEIKGAMIGEPGSRVWCYWNRVYTNPQEDSPNTLHILRLVIEDESFSDFTPATPDGAARAKDSRTVKAIASLFAAAQVEAARWDMKEIQIWNPTSTTLAAVQQLDEKAAVTHRETSSIAALRWYGQGSWQNVDWICNEKYGWC